MLWSKGRKDLLSLQTHVQGVHCMYGSILSLFINLRIFRLYVIISYYIVKTGLHKMVLKVKEFPNPWKYKETKYLKLVEDYLTKFISPDQQRMSLYLIILQCGSFLESITGLQNKMTPGSYNYWTGLLQVYSSVVVFTLILLIEKAF